MNSENTFTLTGRQALGIQEALKEIDWVPGFITSDGKEAKKAFTFSGSVRLRIIQNLTVLEALKKSLDDTRLAIVKAVSNDSKVDLTPDQNREFAQQMNAALDVQQQVELYPIPLYAKYNGNDEDVICLTKCPLPTDMTSKLVGTVLRIKSNDRVDLQPGGIK